MTRATLTGNAALLPARNFLVNGAFEAWQRGTSFSNPSSSAAAYGADRWMTYRTGFASGITTTQGTGLTAATGSYYGPIIQRNSGDTNTSALNLTTSLETIDVRKLAGQTVTVSFYMLGNGAAVSSNLLFSILWGTGSDGNPASGFTSQAAISSTNYLMTSQWQRITATFVVPSNATQLGLNWAWTPSATAAGASDWFSVTMVQLELGGVATPYDFRPTADVLARCRRYYQIISDFLVGGNTTSGNSVFEDLVFPVPMRATPTISVGAITYSNASAYSAAGATTTKLRVQTTITSTGYGIAYGGQIALSAEL